MATTAASRKAELDIAAGLRVARNLISRYETNRCESDNSELMSVANSAVAEAAQTYTGETSWLYWVRKIIKYRLFDYFRTLDIRGRYWRSQQPPISIEEELKYDYTHWQPGVHSLSDCLHPEHGEGSGIYEDVIPALTVDLLAKPLLSKLMATLTRRERAILRQYYWDGLTMKNVGKRFHVNESRVSQIIARAISKMRNTAKGAADAGRNQGK